MRDAERNPEIALLTTRSARARKRETMGLRWSGSTYHARTCGNEKQMIAPWNKLPPGAGTWRMVPGFRHADVCDVASLAISKQLRCKFFRTSRPRNPFRDDRLHFRRPISVRQAIYHDVIVRFQGHKVVTIGIHFGDMGQRDTISVF